MSGGLARFPAPPRPRQGASAAELLVPGRARRLALLRMRAEVWVRVLRWRWRRAQPAVLCWLVDHVWLEAYGCGIRWCERCGRWEPLPVEDGRVIPGRRRR